MNDSLRERLQFLRGPGGSRAALFWLLKAVLRMEVHGFFARELIAGLPPLPPADLRFLELREPADIATLTPALLRELDSQSGAGVEGLLARQTRVYALVSADAVACQLNISTGTLSVDSPIPLQITLGERDTFLAYLYTHEAFRRRGLAELLIRRVCHALAREGFARCLCHIRMTNVPSLAAFRRAGWRCVAWLVTSSGGRLLGVPGSRRAGVRVTPARA